MNPTRIIVIGASAGGVDATIQVLRALPATLNASIFVVIHIPSHSPSFLSDIFNRYTALAVVQPQNMQDIEPGKVYVAPPDYHLMLNKDHIELSKGAKVNNSRPSIDSLFVSAAVAYGRQVIGVVLTGMLDDGSLGLAKIKRCGGIAIVQNPQEATYPQMPLNAIRATNCDFILPISEISKRLIRLVEEPIEPILDMNEFDEAGKLDKLPQSDNFNNGENIYQKGKASVYSCPDCGGVLAEINEDGILRYVCRVGHAFSPDWLLVTQRGNIEKALWTALRALDESISLARNTSVHQSDEILKQEYLEKADDYERQANILRSLLLR